jgi:hypothetical protein
VPSQVSRKYLLSTQMAKVACSNSYYNENLELRQNADGIHAETHNLDDMIIDEVGVRIENKRALAPVKVSPGNRDSDGD